MPNLFSSLWSSVGRKFIMGLTGLLWVGFVTVHLIGNSMLFSSNPEHFNNYAHFLMSTGELLYFFEAALIFLLLFHIISGIAVWLSKWSARPVGYVKKANAGGPSRKSISSSTMIYTGALLLIFLIFHIATFKYGVGSAVQAESHEEIDLYSRVHAFFGMWWYTLFYVVILTLLGFHLRHGFWSAFQTLGISHPRYSPFIYGLGWAIAVILAAGFIAIPLWILFAGGAQ